NSYRIDIPAIAEGQMSTGLGNQYTGTTVVNSGVLNLTSTVNNVALIPGNLTINNGGTVTMVARPGQIAPNSQVQINNGGVLTLVGTNALNRLGFNNTGGSVTPSVNTGTELTLAAEQAITAHNDNWGTTPTISGGGLVLASAAPVINVTGNSLNGLVISA